MPAKLRLCDLLDAEEHSTDPASLTQQMQLNLGCYKDLIRKDVENERAGCLAVLELDRSPLRAYGGKVVYDHLPSFRTSGPQIFVVSCADLGAAWHEQACHRWLTDKERFTFQGHSPEYDEYFSNRSASRKATGNAYCTLQLAAILAPMLEEAVVAGGLSPSGPKILEPEQAESLSRVACVERALVEKPGAKATKRTGPVGTKKVKQSQPDGENHPPNVRRTCEKRRPRQKPASS
jgi:hypothetical protein